MARGWESKQVESQIESAREKQRTSALERLPRGQQTEREKETLRLSRADLQHRIESSGNSRYTEFLMKALQEIERKLEVLSRTGDNSSRSNSTT
jgi:hypothetical protein